MKLSILDLVLGVGVVVTVVLAGCTDYTKLTNLTPVNLNPQTPATFSTGQEAAANPGSANSNSPLGLTGGSLNNNNSTCTVVPNGQFTGNCNAATAVTLCNDGFETCTPIGTQGVCSSHLGPCRSL
jgi:hypothetical protein